jgi:hypothetical protein
VPCVTTMYEVFDENSFEGSQLGSWFRAGGTMFEQEIEMEKKESSIIPLLMIIGLIVSIVGVSVYYLLENRKVLSVQEATPILAASLDSQGPAILHIRTGIIKASVDEKPHDPHYRLLEKAGFLKIGKDAEWKTPVSLTPKGEAFLADIPGVQRSKDDKDKTELYTIPVAQRKLVEVTQISMQNPSRAIVEYTWKWEPNKLGEMLDASGPMVKSFNTWDRATLIQKYSANFYSEGPTKVTLALAKTNKGWQISVD